ncbi:aminoglycoside phosphotransferase family protein [Amycolatopsis sp. cmx-11-51]|uniref:aminoglycoside phosphotransferase family protein n=1 Tax=Amycolatopsis sp. cmx-11-51 TaxID=2785797 RepID=UPI0039E2C29D
MSDGDRSGSDLKIDEALVGRLLAAQFPEWADLPVKPVAKPGVDNMTFRLGDTMSVRLPRYSRWVGQVAREQRWLPFLAPRLPLPVPVPLAKGEPGEGYPFPWSVYAWIDGDVARPENLRDEVEAATDLAEFLAALREIDPTGGPEPEWSNGFRGVPVGDERDSAIVESRLRPKIAALEGLVDTATATAVFDAALAAPAWHGRPVWIHGDPAVGNLLSRDGRVSAVIDFGTVAVGDPATDLITAWSFLSGPARDTFRTLLGVDDATWARGRAWGLSAVLPSPDDVTEAELLRLEELLDDFRREA